MAEVPGSLQGTHAVFTSVHNCSFKVCEPLCAMCVQLLLMNSGVHFSTFPVSGASEIKQICETQLTGEVPVIVP